jgi:hypothetical protein
MSAFRAHQKGVPRPAPSRPAEHTSARAFSSASKPEWLWVLGWSLVLAALTSLPYVVGMSASTPDRQFGGLVYNVLDCNSYIAKMRQGARGEWLFTLPYTSEQHRGAFVYPFYLILGKLAALSGLSPVLVYHVARLASIPLLLVSVYAFLARITPWKAIRRIAFLLIAFSSGLGWLFALLGRSTFAGNLPIDFWVTEGYLFLLVYAMPHLAFAAALLLCLLSVILDTWRWRTRGLLLASALLALLLTAILPFYAGVAYSVLGATWVVDSILHRHADMRRLQVLIASGLPSLPLLAYQGYVFALDPFFRVWAAQNTTLSPHILHYALGYLFLLPWAAANVISAIHRHKKLETLPVVWALIVPILVYLPVRFQRRFLIGFPIPLSLLAVPGFARYALLPLSRSRIAHSLLRFHRYTLSGLRRWTVAAWIALAATSNVLLVAGSCAGAWTQSPTMFHDRTELDALDWLGIHTNPQDAVLCAFETGNYVPARAGNRVFLGHGPETVHSEQKKEMVARFFDAQTDDTWRQWLLREYGIAYVVIGPRERALGGFSARGISYLLPAYQNSEYHIYRVAQ